MQTIQVGTAANGESVDLAYQDVGAGRPVVLIHGWPASHAMWQCQLTELPKHGIRAIAYDRRGFGHSSKPWKGYDYDTMADQASKRKSIRHRSSESADTLGLTQHQITSLRKLN